MNGTCRICGDSFESRGKHHQVCGSTSCKAASARERAARWTEAHPSGGRDASRRHRAKNGNTPWPAKRALGAEVTALKESTPCTDCGVNFPAICMDFDHLPHFTKVNNIGTMVAHGHPREHVMAEIAKCEIVCANCHRIRTSQRRTA